MYPIERPPTVGVIFILAKWLDTLFQWIRSNNKVTSVTTTYTAMIPDYLILCDATGGAFTITLPAATAVLEKEYTIKKTDASVNAITVNGGGTNIDGAATASLAAQWNTITVKSNGTTWSQISGL